jgi:hypothetical protein
MDHCPLPLQNNKLNIANHIIAIKEHGLGPADPRQSNMAFWKDKGKKWGITEGDARGRLCSNCEHYINTTQIQDCIDEGQAATFKTSMVDPSLVDLESKPVAYCMLYDITCSPVRTCDSQELGGPIDDVKYEAIKLAQALKDSHFDFDEFEDPFKDSTVD